MDIQNQYLISVGTTRGVIAITNCQKDKPAKYELGKGEGLSEITALQWGKTAEEIIIGYKEGTIKLYNYLNYQYTKTIDNLKGKGPVVDVSLFKKHIIAARLNGIINLWSKRKTDILDLNLQEDSTLECALLHNVRGNVIGTGGTKNDFKLWDVETKQCIFKAKSLGHDSLNLPIPTSVRRIAFFPEDEKLSACITKEGYALLYDERAQRRPISKFIEPKASYTAISTAYEDRQCLVGTTKGYIQLIDLRSPTNCIKTFESFTGSVTDIVCDPINSVVASTSLDRFLRIHDMNSKKLLHKEYLKQSLTKLLLRPMVKEEFSEDLKDEIVDNKTENEMNGDAEEDIDEEYENLFNKMETIGGEKQSKKKRKASENVKKKKKLKGCNSLFVK